MNKCFVLIEATVLFLICIIQASIGENDKNAGKMFKYHKYKFGYFYILL